MRYFIYPYKAGSASAKALSQALGGKLIKTSGSKFKTSPNKLVINWGSSQCPYDGGLNPRSLVGAFGSKLQAFQRWAVPEGPRTPEWSVDASKAFQWLADKKTVLARTLLTSSQGQGIIVLDGSEKEYTIEDIPQAPLYVRYIPKDHEYRVHIFKGEVIDVQRKVAAKDTEVTNWKIRSHRHGFRFIRTNSEGASYKEAVQEDVIQQAQKAFAVSGLTFGAFDIVYNRKLKQAFVLECNLAPGLEGHTIEVYRDAIKKYYP